MKIICTKEEYTRMVARCATNIDESERTGVPCSGCILLKTCESWNASKGGLRTPDDWLMFLPDITEIHE